MAKEYVGDKVIQPLEKQMNDLCNKRGFDYDTAFKGFLDYLIWLFDPEGNMPDGWRFNSEDAQAFFVMSKTYADIMNSQLRKEPWYDAFGDLYMALHPGGGGKAQFFTPPDVANVVAEVNLSGIDIEKTDGTLTPFGHRITINDPAAGSSRMLMAGAGIVTRKMEIELGWDANKVYANRPYIIAEDLDMNCVKMSAINIMMHGYFGECVCHNTLEEPHACHLGYFINETMWPFPSGIPSIRKCNDARKFCCTSLWASKKRQREQQLTDRNNATAVLPLGGEVAAPSSDLPKEKKQPQQLTLW